jgi:cell wall-associated NlpC family hydrolase
MIATLPITEWEALVGIPFLHGGRSRQGLDCWGLIMEAYRLIGIAMPDPFNEIGPKWSRRDAAIEPWAEFVSRYLVEWRQTPDPVPGGVGVFSNYLRVPDHIGLVLDHSRFLHAVSGADQVTIIRLSLLMEVYRDHLVGWYVHPDL